MTLGCDYSFARPSATALKAMGASFACRYLSDDPSKNLSAGEARELVSAGIAVVSNWETTATRAADGYGAGAADAGQAESQHLACGGPADRPIYFSVDYDAGSEVVPYFRGVSSVLGAGRVGVYGSVHVCELVAQAGAAKWFWRTQSTGWRGGAASTWLWFHILQTGESALGGQVDLDEATMADFGQWGIGDTGDDDMPFAIHLDVPAGTLKNFRVPPPNKSGGVPYGNVFVSFVTNTGDCDIVLNVHNSQQNTDRIFNESMKIPNLTPVSKQMQPGDDVVTVTNLSGTLDLGVLVEVDKA